MALVELEPGTGCPPHHWFIGDPVQRVQLWTCLRCGAERQQERPQSKQYKTYISHKKAEVLPTSTPSYRQSGNVLESGASSTRTGDGRFSKRFPEHLSTSEDTHN